MATLPQVAQGYLALFPSGYWLLLGALLLLGSVGLAAVMIAAGAREAAQRQGQAQMVTSTADARSEEAGR